MLHGVYCLKPNFALNSAFSTISLSMIIRGLYRIYVLLVFILLLSCNRDSSSGINTADFFINPEKLDYKIAPDGKYISYLQDYGAKRQLIVSNIKGDSIWNITDTLKTNVSVYFWASDSSLVYMQSSARGGNPEVFAVGRTGKESRLILSEKEGRLRFIKLNSYDNDHVLIALNKRDSSFFDAYALSSETGKLTLLEKNPGNIIRWIADEKGRVRMAVAGDNEHESLLFKTPDGRFKPIIKNDFKTHISLVSFKSDDPDNAYVLSNYNRDKTALVEMDCSTGEEIQTIYANDSVDVSEVIHSHEDDQLLYAIYNKARKHRYYFNDSERKLFEKLHKQLPGMDFTTVSYDRSYKNLVLHAYSDKNPGAYYMYNKTSGKLLKLSEVNARLANKQLATMSPFTFRSDDSLTIHGYLTLPEGGNKKKLPLVVIPHEGPSSRNYWGYSPSVQFLASRGYAVMQVNFRGSKGYGKRFWTAGFREWGSSIQKDIEKGVSWLVSNGIVDEDRVAIFGNGFGGYCALYGLCFNADLYKCGISRSGFVNLFTYIKSIPPHLKTMVQMYYEMIGNPGKEIGYFRAVSPIFHSEKIKDPVLLVEDLKNPRGNISETNQFVRKLKNKDVKITYLVREDMKDEYTFTDEVKFHTELERFLKENL